MLSPDTYAKYVAPPMKKVCEFIHRNYDLKVFYHCCGSCYDLIPTFIDIGYDILNPVQISAASMDPSSLKESFGDRVVFWGGGCDTQGVLPHATPAEVRDHVRGLVQTFKPRGGFVFSAVHNIVGDVAPDRIVAMFDEACESGSYEEAAGQPEPGNDARGEK
jgi:uroporphyrinogen decarboxylase